MIADDTALLAIDSDPALASQKLQQHLDLLQECFDKWKIKINQTKSSQITLQQNAQIVHDLQSITFKFQYKQKFGLYLDQN
jgi:hypothetical protein